jgi:predicted nucleotidyltransferase
MYPRKFLAESLAQEPEIAFALLMGSRANGRPRPDSDWDIAVYAREDLSPEQRFALRLRLDAQLEPLGKVDIILLNEAPALLGHRALQGEKILDRDPSAYVRYFVRTLARSNDERYFRDIHAKARLRRLKEGRFGRP